MYKRKAGLASEQGHVISSNIRESRVLYGTDADKWVDVVAKIVQVLF